MDEGEGVELEELIGTEGADNGRCLLRCEAEYLCSDGG